MDTDSETMDGSGAQWLLHGALFRKVLPHVLSLRERKNGGSRMPPRFAQSPYTLRFTTCIQRGPSCKKPWLVESHVTGGRPSIHDRISRPREPKPERHRRHYQPTNKQCNQNIYCGRQKRKKKRKKKRRCGMASNPAARGICCSSSRCCPIPRRARPRCLSFGQEFAASAFGCDAAAGPRACRAPRCRCGHPAAKPRRSLRCGESCGGGPAPGIPGVVAAAGGCSLPDP